MHQARSPQRHDPLAVGNATGAQRLFDPQGPGVGTGAGSGRRDRDRTGDRNARRASGLSTEARVGAGPGNVQRGGRDRHVGDGVVQVGGRPRTAIEVEQEAKAASEALKELLKAHAPWSREVENLRQRARNFYLTILFAHPLSPQAQSLDPLWLNTSYTLISAYRSSVASAELAASSNAPPNRKSHNNFMGSPEYRKAITRFRQALASEESFYRTLIGRIAGFYQLQEFLTPYLGRGGPAGGVGGNGGLSIPLPDGLPDGVFGGSEEGLAPLAGKEEAREKVGLVYKALICLGDLERYKEQYSTQSINNKKGAGSRSKAGGEEVFGKAVGYYEVARGLMPDDGSAFNQLAVISTYLNDDFQTTYFYFRALAVRSAFKNGEEILERFLRKIFERWRNQEYAETETDDISRTKREILVVVAILYRRNGLSQLSNLYTTIYPSLRNLLAERQLPSELIVKLTAIVIGSHWHARQSSSVAPAAGERNQATDINRKRDSEIASLDFLLGIGTVLLDVALAELEEIAPQGESALVDDDEEDDYANGDNNHGFDDRLPQLISAVLRRILPALRILSKWLKLHLDYLLRQNQAQTSIQTFWKSYHRFIHLLKSVFPNEKLPSLVNSLEEDIDMRGYIPLSRGMSSTRFGDSVGTGENGGEEEHPVHPNEEQLMRLADLQVDAQLIAQLQAGGARASFSGLPIPILDSRHLGVVEDDIASVSTETEDDPVNLAMRATLPDDSVIGDDEDDEEVIVWNNRSASPEIHTPPAKPPTSAFDLLQNLILENHPLPSSTTPKGVSPHLPPPGTSQIQHRPSPPIKTNSGQGSPGLLFGGDAGGIWRMTREESEKGMKRASTNVDKDRDEAVQKEAIKAIWSQDQPIQPYQPQHSSLTPTISVPGVFQQQQQQLQNPQQQHQTHSMATHATHSTNQHITSSSTMAAAVPGTSSWAINDAASLYAGLSSGWNPTPATYSVGYQPQASSTAQIPQIPSIPRQGSGSAPWIGHNAASGNAQHAAQAYTGSGYQPYAHWGQAYNPT